MQNIFIKVFDEHPKDPDIDCIGQIILKNNNEEIFKEKFIMQLDTYSTKDYEKQWKEGLERIKTHDISCLVANAQDIFTNHPLVVLWTLYKKDNKVYIQNSYFFDSKPGFDMRKLRNFNMFDCYDFVSQFKLINQDGEEIWTKIVDLE